MLFVCADPAIPRESQIVFALKTLCGFSVDEIALRLFQNNEAIYKRLQRARATLREQREESSQLDTPAIEALAARLPAVLQIIYLLFTEGYSSAQPDTVIRRELCEEAVRLGLLLVEHPVGAVPETDALLALMYLDAARFDARVDGAGGLLLLEEQDRSRWDRELIQPASRICTARRVATSFPAITSRRGSRPSIASRRHTPRLAGTKSRGSTSCSTVSRRRRSTRLNRSIAVAEWKGPAAGLALLESLKPPTWLLGYYLWDATLGELYRRRGDRERARVHLTRALDAAPTHAEKALLRRRLDACAI